MAYAFIRGTEGIVGLLAYGRDGSMPPISDHEYAHIGRYASYLGLNVQQAIYRARLEDLAFNDPMTGLSNYRYFERRFQEELSRCERYRHSLTVVMIDIDRFKGFNDTWGHRAGDALLTQFGLVLRNALRDADIPARYGGEEFVVICPETTGEQAKQIIARIREAIAATVFSIPYRIGDDLHPASITVSIGAATFPADARAGEALLRLADRALYEAKESGRNCAVHAGSHFGAVR